MPPSPGPTDGDPDARRDALVAPADWRNPTPTGRYHLVIIGAGTAGLVCAAAAAQLGARVALIERSRLGGDCLNVGCVPSKGLIAAAAVATTLRTASRFGIQATAVDIDFTMAMQRMRRQRADIAAHDSVARFSGLGVDVFRGTARFAGPRSVLVDGEQELRFNKAVIATGTRPVLPDIEGLDQTDPLTNETVFDLNQRPERLAVIGGGPIGCELAQAFARLGSSVTLLQRGAEILSKEDADAAAVVRQTMSADGVRIHTGSDDLQIGVEEDGTRLSFTVGDEHHDCLVDRVLLATGRRPVIDLDLDRAGIEADATQGILVDDRLRSSNRHVYAAGDVCTRFRFTHAADFMARTVLRNALFAGRSRFSALIIPRCTYTAPALAQVGLTVREAEDQGIAYDSYEVPFAEVDRAMLDGDEEGFVRILAKRGSDRILGATIVGAHAGDLIGQVACAMTNGIGLAGLARTIHPYPTQAEAIRQAGDRYQRTRLTPLVAWALRTWLAWRR